jgi:hypothetical protein
MKLSIKGFPAWTFQQRRGPEFMGRRQELKALECQSGEKLPLHLLVGLLFCLSINLLK